MEYPNFDSREKYERGMKGFSLFIDLYATWMDSVSDFNTLSMEAMNKMQDKTVDLKSETGPERSKELYNVWIETYSGIFNEFLKSDHFASDIGLLWDNPGGYPEFRIPAH